MEDAIFMVKEKNSERDPGVFMEDPRLEHFAYLHQNFAFCCHNPDNRMLGKNLAKAWHRNGPIDPQSLSVKIVGMGNSSRILFSEL